MLDRVDRERVVEAARDVDPVLAPLALTLKRMLAAFERDVGISAPKWFVLSMLLRVDGMSQGEVWQKFEMDPSRVTRVAQALEGDGLIRRARDDADNRVVRMYLTSEGRRVVQEYSGRRERFQRRIHEALSEEKAEELCRMLGRIVERMQD